MNGRYRKVAMLGILALCPSAMVIGLCCTAGTGDDGPLWTPLETSAIRGGQEYPCYDRAYEYLEGCPDYGTETCAADGFCNFQTGKCMDEEFETNTAWDWYDTTYYYDLYTGFFSMGSYPIFCRGKDVCEDECEGSPGALFCKRRVFYHYDQYYRYSFYLDCP